MSGFPVTIVESGGMAVTNAPGHSPASVVESGGVPVTLVDSGGIPMTLIGVVLPPVAQAMKLTMTVTDSALSSQGVTGFAALVDQKVMRRDALQMFDAGVNGAKSDGGDIRVFAEDGVTPLPFDLRNFSKPAQTIELWVRFPTLSTSAKTIVVKWGDQTLSRLPATDPNGRNTVWQDYEAVLSLNSVGDLTDLTGKGRDGTAVVTGALTARTETHPFSGSWLDFDNAWINLANSIPALSGTTSGTLQAWYNDDNDPATNQANNGGALVSNRLDGVNANFHQFAVGHKSQARAFVNVLHNGTEKVNIVAENDVVRGLPHLAHMVWDGTTLATIIDGQQKTSVANTADAVTPTKQLRIGNYFQSTLWFDGLIGEVRVRRTRLPDAHMAMEYRNQQNSLGFWSGVLSATGLQVRALTPARSLAAVSSRWPTISTVTVPPLNQGVVESAIHPKMIDSTQSGFPTWNGKRYWMAYTPYPNAADPDKYENPCVVCSDDTLNWTTPVGGSNPIEPRPVGWESGQEYYSDTAMVLDTDGKMWVFWRHYSRKSTRKWQENTLAKSSTDGVNWSPVMEIGLRSRYQATNNINSALLTSPAFAKVGDKWYCWGNNAGVEPTAGVNLWTASSPTGPWRGPLNVAISGLPANSEYLWHLDVEPHNGGFAMLAQTTVPGQGDKSGSLYLGYSGERGTNFTFKTEAVAPVGTFRHYRSSLTRKTDNSGWIVIGTNMNSRSLYQLIVDDPV